MKNKLKELRESKGLTLINLSDLTGFASTQLNRIENGKASFTQEQIITLSDFFNVSTDYLLGKTIDVSLTTENVIPLIEELEISDDLNDYSYQIEKYKKTDLVDINGYIWYTSFYLLTLFEEYLVGDIFLDRVYVLVKTNDNINSLENSQLILAVIPHTDPQTNTIDYIPDLYIVKRFQEPKNNVYKDDDLFLVSLSSTELFKLNQSDNNKKWLFIGSVHKIEIET